MTAFKVPVAPRVVLGLSTLLATALVTGLVSLFAPGDLHAQAPRLTQRAPAEGIPVAVPESVAERVAERLGEADVARGSSFLDRQLEYPRVRRAYERQAERVEAALEARGVEDVREVFFRVFKRERELEVWVREPGAPSFAHVKTYPVCAVSGRLGPKRRQGDRQVPEGFYEIDIFNPRSRFHLSMRVNYPNAVDRVRGHRPALGGDIYIHGGCATIGCVPVTDDYIEELYLIAANARSAGQRSIPVHIFPTRLDDAGLHWLAETYGTDFVDFRFWQNLQEGYHAFERTRALPRVAYDGRRYTFDPGPTAPLAGSGDDHADPGA